MRALQERLTTESVIEAHLQRVVKARKGLTFKLRFMLGWPDRVVLLPGGVILFAELKRPVGGVFEPLQLRVHQRLRRLGFDVFVWHTKDVIDNHFKE